MKICAACLVTETNTFTPIFTGLDDFNVVQQSDIQAPGTGHMLSMLK